MEAGRNAGPLGCFQVALGLWESSQGTFCRLHKTGRPSHPATWDVATEKGLDPFLSSLHCLHRILNLEVGHGSS